MNCTPFVRQYDILSNKWGVLLCQKEYQTNDHNDILLFLFCSAYFFIDIQTVLYFNQDTVTHTCNNGTTAEFL